MVPSKIGICGDACVGKTTTARMLAEILAYEHFSVGEYCREMGIIGGTLEMPIRERNRYLHSLIMDMMFESRGIVFDGRSIHMSAKEAQIRGCSEQTLMVLLTADNITRVDRYMARSTGLCLEEAVITMYVRSKQMKQEFFDLYGRDILVPELFDLTICVTNLNPLQVTDHIMGVVMSYAFEKVAARY